MCIRDSIENEASIQNLATGSYTVTLTHTFGCETIQNFQVEATPLPSMFLPTNQKICKGSEVTIQPTSLENFQGGIAYMWSTGSDNNQLIRTIEESEEFSVTVTDANGCTVTASTSITLVDPTITDWEPKIELCEGENTTLQTTVNNAQYELSLIHI